MIGIIGAGAFGTALAQSLNKPSVALYSDMDCVVESINKIRVNLKFLPCVSISKNITAYTNLENIEKCSVIFISVPAQIVRYVCEDLRKKNVPNDVPLILCSKGIEQKTGLLMSEVVESELSNPVFVLSGPSFAHDLARCNISHVTLSGKDIFNVTEVCKKIPSCNMFLHPNDDPIGVQVCGVFKNVLAVGGGLISSFGESSKAAFITKGINEIRSIIIALGGKEDTILDYCGVGDILLTCCSEKSRNTDFGMRLCRSEIDLPLSSDAISKLPLAEGAITASVLPKFFERIPDLNSKIFKTIYDLLYNGLNLSEAIKLLLH